MKIKNLKFLFLLIACVANSVLLVAQTNQYMTADTVAVPMSSFDFIRGKVKSVITTYYDVKNSKTIVFEKGKEVNGMATGFARYYDESGNILRDIDGYNIETAYIYDTQGRLITILISNSSDAKSVGCAESSKIEKTYDNEGKIKESMHYKRFKCETEESDDSEWNNFSLREWEKSVLANAIKDWNIESRGEYVYGKSGKLQEIRWYEYDNDSKQFWFNYKSEYDDFGKLIIEDDYDDLVPDSCVPRYNAKGEMLLKGHKFKCTFDKYGNWLTKIDCNQIYIDTDGSYFFIERKIEYYK